MRNEFFELTYQHHVNEVIVGENKDLQCDSNVVRERKCECRADQGDAGQLNVIIM